MNVAAIKMAPIEIAAAVRNVRSNLDTTCINDPPVQRSTTLDFSRRWNCRSPGTITVRSGHFLGPSQKPIRAPNSIKPKLGGIANLTSSPHGFDEGRWEL